MKGKALTIIGVLFIVAIFVVGYEKGYFSSLLKSDNSSDSHYSAEDVEKKEAIIVETQAVMKDEVQLIKKGGTGISEYIELDKEGNELVDGFNYRYEVKNCGSEILKELPEDIQINYYPSSIDVEYGPAGAITGAYSYVIVTIEVTNINDDSWIYAQEDITPQNFLLGLFNDEGVFATSGIGTGRIGGCSIEKETTFQGHITLLKGESVTIKNCYMIQDEYLQSTLAVKVEFAESNREGNIAYLMVGNGE